jgi:beta-glucosidase
MGFPKNFVWGAAAASYQVEGAAFEDGKGLSVWDMVCRKQGFVWEENTGNLACDHYHRWKEDARLMGRLGLKAYRLSVSWPRVLPEGTGAVNARGLDFYDRLVDELLKQGVDPWVTLFHWDYPHALFCKGGWLNRDSADWFADYTRVIVDRLSDRVTHWMTQNEPQCYIGLGHLTGEHAPGLKMAWAEILRMAHHSLLAHGRAVQVIRAASRTKSCVGAAPVGVVSAPATSSRADVAAARQATFRIRTRSIWSNTWWADPMILGRYPEDGLEVFGRDVPKVRRGDMETICQKLDFYGCNIYSCQTVRAVRGSGWEPVKGPEGPPLTTMTWRVTPQCLYWGPKFLHERYRLPIVITENGMANCDWVHLDGKVHDPQRIDYVRRHLREVRRAIEDRVPVTGYLYWSILDNFEWAHGYKQRFGLVYVDYETGRRIPKDSALWYRSVIAKNGANI